MCVEGKNMTEMTVDEVVAEMRSDSPLNRARQKFSSAAARIEQESSQGLPPLRMRAMEFAAVRDIVEALGLEMPASN